jgi:hypothetical protein
LCRIPPDQRFGLCQSITSRPAPLSIFALSSCPYFYQPPAPETLSPEYASPQERAQYAAADDFSFEHFWEVTMSGPMERVDLPALGTDFAIPIFILQGQEDLTALPELAKAYFDSIKAPRK